MKNIQKNSQHHNSKWDAQSKLKDEMNTVTTSQIFKKNSGWYEVALGIPGICSYFFFLPWDQNTTVTVSFSNFMNNNKKQHAIYKLRHLCIPGKTVSTGSGWTITNLSAVS